MIFDVTPHLPKDPPLFVFTGMEGILHHVYSEENVEVCRHLTSTSNLVGLSVLRRMNYIICKGGIDFSHLNKILPPENIFYRSPKNLSLEKFDAVGSTFAFDQKDEAQLYIKDMNPVGFHLIKTKIQSFWGMRLMYQITPLASGVSQFSIFRVNRIRLKPGEWKW